ncbi:MAG: hypothetical protein C0618_05095 [Desulfuromonas sp.]|nr:MAG: hypothetical protein C0618_05095 [Desulfuromonas sp.]
MELVLKGELTIQQIAELKQQVVDGLAQDQELSLNVGEVTRVDLTFCQLLCSAHRTARNAGRSFRLVNLSTAVDNAINQAGLSRNKVSCEQGCIDSCLWLTP